MGVISTNNAPSSSYPFQFILIEKRNLKERNNPLAGLQHLRHWNKRLQGTVIFSVIGAQKRLIEHATNDFHEKVLLSTKTDVDGDIDRRIEDDNFTKLWVWKSAKQKNAVFRHVEYKDPHLRKKTRECSNYKPFTTSKPSIKTVMEKLKVKFWERWVWISRYVCSNGTFWQFRSYAKKFDF